ncbi:hypothetical protein [Vibrio phage vB_VmeM-Yong XC32]|nr:hypothetical protein [Vibrio phage vB_VmeM-Yong XC31]QAX96550.1 hypothetical protein [Vibrio phage vB_VmeM-Yong XC32]QAX96868.1 hypothetical protein [Vibrio phage vB_VmeM-Yong MS31]QAX97173.1 hypothetical protein [Vibrio phage vB_VmeM-Yong MS32]
MLTPTSKVPSSAIYAFANLIGFDQYDLLLVESVLGSATMEEFLGATYNVGRLKNQTLMSKVIQINWETSTEETRITFALASDGDMYRELLIDAKENITKSILVKDTKPDWHQEIKVFNESGFLLSGENSDNEGCGREILYRSLEVEDRG